MITLKASTVTTFLPNPTIGDTENVQVDLQVSYAMNGHRRTYVKKGPDNQLTYTFRLSRMKAEELFEFYRAFHSRQITLINHKDETWLVKFLTSPAEFESPRRWKLKREEVGVTLRFQGTKQ